jgi:uncharacterized protein
MREDAAGNLRHLLAAALAAATLAAFPLAQAGDTPPGAPPPPATIRVTGDARITAKPDRVQIDVGVETRAAQSQDAAAQNARAVDAVLAAVRKAAPGADLKTVSYSLTPIYQYRKNAEPAIDGYAATNLVRVTLDDLAKSGAVIDSATQGGANRVQGVQFTLRDPDSVRAAALREAATRARAEAEVLAGALGLRIVRVLTVEEQSPRVVPVRVYAAAARVSAAAEAAPTPVEAGTLDVTAEVTLSVEVAPAGH